MAATLIVRGELLAFAWERITGINSATDRDAFGDLHLANQRKT